MTECNGIALRFSSLSRRAAVADFAGGTLTSDAGGLLLREVDRRLGLIGALADGLTDPRDPARIVHDQCTMLAQRIFGIALGYEDLNDHATLRSDPLFSVLAEQSPTMTTGTLDAPLASPPTLCRLENRVDLAALVRMAKVFVEQFIASFDTPPRELILDCDAADDPVHGTQQGRFFHGYSGLCTSRHDSVETVQGRGPRGRPRAPRRAASVECLPAARTVRPRAGRPDRQPSAASRSSHPPIARPQPGASWG